MGRVLALMALIAFCALVWVLVVKPYLDQRRAEKVPFSIEPNYLPDGRRQVLLVRGSERKVFRTVASSAEDPYDAEWDEAVMAAESEAKDWNKRTGR